VNIEVECVREVIIDEAAEVSFVESDFERDSKIENTKKETENKKDNGGSKVDSLDGTAVTALRMVEAQSIHEKRGEGFHQETIEH
jgi:hypothetical protein